MKTSWILAGLLLCCTFSLARSDVLEKMGTGQGLLTACTTTTSDSAGDLVAATLDYGACMGFIKAVSQTLILASQLCQPEEITFGQAQKIVVKYLNDHPERLHIASAWLVREALLGAFPCPVRKPAKHPAK